MRMMLTRAAAVLAVLAAVYAAAPAAGTELVYDAVRHGSIQVVSLGTVQTVSVTNTSAATTNVIGGTGRTVVLLLCTEDCYVVTGSSPTATTSDTLLPAMTFLPIWVNGGVDKIAFLREGTDGTGKVTEAP